MMARRTRKWKLRLFEENRRRIVSFLIVFVLIAFVLSFARPAAIFSKALKQIGINATPQDIQDVAAGLTLIGVGLTIMVVATSFAAVPVVGVGLVLVGAVIAGFGAFKIWQWNRRRKPASTNLSNS